MVSGFLFYRLFLLHLQQKDAGIGLSVKEE